jgi:hypothetical protein
MQTHELAEALVKAVKDAMMGSAHPLNEDAEPGNWCDEHSIDGDVDHFAKRAAIAVLRELAVNGPILDIKRGWASNLADTIELS